MKKQIIFFISILISINITIFAQKTIKTISGGVLNGKAIELAKPEFPAAAAAVGACGAVNVKVVINEQGTIESAEAVSGHPLLREAAEKAARKAKFNPTTLSDEAVKVAGVIIYVFSFNGQECGVKTIPRTITRVSDTDTSETYLQDTNNPQVNSQDTDKPAVNTQNSIQKSDSIDGGVVNGKALSLPAPIYPAAAKVVRAGGLVAVQVLISEEGNVISAKSVSGHPLLRAVSEKAALSSKFRPTSLQGIPVKVSGIISYVYNLPMSFIEVGYELARVEKIGGGYTTFPAYRIENYLPKDWLDEKKEIKKLEYYFQAKEFEKTKQLSESQTEKIEKEKELVVSKTDDKTIDRIEPLVRTAPAGVTRSLAPPIIDFENFNSSEFSRELQPKIKNHFDSKDKNLWYFNLGIILGNITAEINEIEKDQKISDDLKQLLDNIPSNIPEQLIEQVKIIREFSQRTLSDDEKTKLISTIIRIKNLSDEVL